MKVRVTRVVIPPMSTIGYGYGATEDGREVEFVGDHRPMRVLGEAVARADGEPFEVELEDWQIVSVASKSV